jgi:N utilization substance protein B
MASRHRSRELAVQLTYQWDLDPKSLTDARTLSRFWAEQAQSSDDNRNFFEFLVKGVAEHLPAIDRRLNAALKNWKLDRIEKVDLAILRVAVFEMFHSEASDKPDAPVVINEAVELAKKFGVQSSPAFINGILDALSKAPKA